MSRGRNFVFTLNNPDVLPQPFLDQLVALPNFRYTIFQEERGQEGTIHYQGYLEFSNPKTLAYLKKHVSNRAHFETRKGTAASCIDYCSKEDTRVSGPYSAGTPAQKTQGQRTDLEEACATLAAGGLKRLREELPHMYVKFSRGFEALAAATPMRPREAPEVIVLYGPTGTGKTKYFFDTAPIDESWTLPLPQASGSMDTTLNPTFSWMTSQEEPAKWNSPICLDSWTAIPFEYRSKAASQSGHPQRSTSLPTSIPRIGTTIQTGKNTITLFSDDSHDAFSTQEMDDASTVSMTLSYSDDSSESQEDNSPMSTSSECLFSMSQ